MKKPMRFIISMIIWLVILTGSWNGAYADDEVASWFIELGLGYSIPSYGPDSFQTSWDRDISISDTHIPIALDFAIYATINDKLLLGVTLYGTVDYIELNGSTEQINTYLLGLVTQYYLTDHVTKGLFIKTALGLGFGKFSALVSGSSSSLNFDSGLAGLIGLGYAFPLGMGHTAFTPGIDFYFNTLSTSSGSFTGVYGINFMLNFLL